MDVEKWAAQDGLGRLASAPTVSGTYVLHFLTWSTMGLLGGCLLLVGIVRHEWVSVAMGIAAIGTIVGLALMNRPIVRAAQSAQATRTDTVVLPIIMGDLVTERMTYRSYGQGWITLTPTTLEIDANPAQGWNGTDVDHIATIPLTGKVALRRERALRGLCMPRLLLTAGPHMVSVELMAPSGIAFIGVGRHGVDGAIRRLSAYLDGTRTERR